jgi:1-acyl-sn-glycerol-3-phosphate acyltransferase
VRIVKLIVLLLLFPGFLVFAFIVLSGTSLFRLPAGKISSRLMRQFTALLRILLNVRTTVEGAGNDLSAGGHYIVCNHLGYLDGIVLGSLFPVIFVTKLEVKRWPVIGPLLTLLGTIFVDRQNKHGISTVVERISMALRPGTHVLIFPEGTSTNGERLYPFQSSFFAAPLMARAAVVPLTLTYESIDRQPVTPANRDRVYWYGEMSFASHVWDLLGTQRIEVTVKIHPKIETAQLQNNSRGRKRLSQACYDIIAAKAACGNEATRGALPLISGVMDGQP